MNTQTKLSQIWNILFTPQPSALARVGNNKPIGRPKREVDFRPAPRKLPPYPDVRRQDINFEDVTRIVLFELLEKNCHHFAVHDRVGRVALVSYQPHNQHDPILPVPLFRLSPEFKTAYRNLANVLSSWVDAMFNLYYQCEQYNNYNGYLHRKPAKPAAVYTENYTKKIIEYGNEALYWAQQSNAWTEEEWQYFSYQLRLSMAQPDRFVNFNGEATKNIWRKAVAYNISLTKQ